MKKETFKIHPEIEKIKKVVRSFNLGFYDMDDDGYEWFSKDLDRGQRADSEYLSEHRWNEQANELCAKQNHRVERIKKDKDIKRLNASVWVEMGEKGHVNIGIDFPKVEKPAPKKKESKPAPKKKESKPVIKMTYVSSDGYRETRSYKTLKGAQAFAKKWLGSTFDFTNSYAVSGDGIGKVMWAGVTGGTLFNIEEPKPEPKPVSEPSDDEVIESLTDLEKKMIIAIASDDYNQYNGNYPEALEDPELELVDLNCWTWIDQWADETDIFVNQAKGVLSSLVKKGIVWTETFEHPDDADQTGFEARGLKALRKIHNDLTNKNNDSKEKREMKKTTKDAAAKKEEVIMNLIGDDTIAQADLSKSIAKDLVCSATTARRYLKELYEAKKLTKITDGKKVSWKKAVQVKTVKETNHGLDEDVKEVTDKAVKETKPTKSTRKNKKGKKAADTKKKDTKPAKQTATKKDRYTRADAFSEAVKSGVKTPDAIIKKSNAIYIAHGGKDNIKEAKWFYSYGVRLLKSFGSISIDVKGNIIYKAK